MVFHFGANQSAMVGTGCRCDGRRQQTTCQQIKFSWTTTSRSRPSPLRSSNKYIISFVKGLRSSEQPPGSTKNYSGNSCFQIVWGIHRVPKLHWWEIAQSSHPVGRQLCQKWWVLSYFNHCCFLSWILMWFASRRVMWMANGKWHLPKALGGFYEKSWESLNCGSRREWLILSSRREHQSICSYDLNFHHSKDGEQGGLPSSDLFWIASKCYGFHFQKKIFGQSERRRRCPFESCNIIATAHYLLYLNECKTSLDTVVLSADLSVVLRWWKLVQAEDVATQKWTG